VLEKKQIQLFEKNSITDWIIKFVR
jgi:hypothetical protein